MTVVGRLGPLFVVGGGAALPFVDGLRSPPSIWYGAVIVFVGVVMVAYAAVSSPSARRPQPSTEPSSRSTSPEAETSSSTQSTGSEQTAKDTESSRQEAATSTIDDDPDPADFSPSADKPERPSTTVKIPQDLPATTQPTQRTTTRTGSARRRTASRTTTRKKRRVFRTTPPRQDSVPKANNRYFTPVESNRAIRFVDIDTKFSYLDVDWGPEVVELDPIPDLVEVDIGPSAVSQELVRSPIEIKISSFLKALFAPTPPRAAFSSTDESTRSTTTESQACQRRDNTHPGRRSAARDSRDRRYREQDRRVYRSDDPWAPVERDKQPGRSRSQSPGREPVVRSRRSVAMASYGSREDTDVAGTRWLDTGLFSTSNLRTAENPLIPDLEMVDESMSDPIYDERLGRRTPFDVRQEYSPLQRDAPDPFGCDDAAPAFSEAPEPPVNPAEPRIDSVERFKMFSDKDPAPGFELFDWAPDGAIEEPVVELGIEEEMFGLDRFVEATEEPVGLSGLDANSGSNPLLPESDELFPDDSVAKDWLSF